MLMPASAITVNDASPTDRSQTAQTAQNCQTDKKDKVGANQVT
jgi:hypothetical protein